MPMLGTLGHRRAAVAVPNPHLHQHQDKARGRRVLAQISSLCHRLLLSLQVIVHRSQVHGPA